MKWFKHDSNANRDKNLKKVLMRYGSEGYGLYWYCIELISAPIDANNINFELEHDAEILAHDLKMDSLKVEEIMRYMVTLGLFEASGDTITCMKLAKRIENSLVRSPQLKLIQKQLAEEEKRENLLKDSESFGKLPNGAGDASKNSCLEVDVDIDSDLEKSTTATNGEPRQIPKSYTPSKNTVTELLDQGVSEEFIDEYLPEYCQYWETAGTVRVCWDSLFFRQCLDQYKRRVLKVA